MDKVCKIEDCSKKAWTQGFCNKHYVSARFAGVMCSVNGCNNDAARSGNRCIAHYSEWLYSPEGRASRRVKKTADHVECSGAHMRLVAELGRASTHECVDCNNPAAEWSLKYDSEERLVSMAGITSGRIYSTKTEDYEPRCMPCHRKYDATHGNKSSGLPEGYSARLRPETRVKAENAIRLVKQGKTVDVAGQIVGISGGMVSRYFQLIEGISIREWKKAQKAGAAR